MNFTFFSILLLLSSCATISDGFHGIALSDMNKVRVGQTDKNGIQTLFGRAQEIRSDFKPKEIWVYRVDSDIAEDAQNASFTFDQNGILIGAVWLPAGTENVLRLQQILAHFKNLEFKTNKVGWDKQGHFFSDDTRYIDEKNGVSFLLNGSDQAVMSVFFGLPVGRIPAKL